MGARLLNGLVALLAFALGLFLAGHHPLGAVPAVALFLALTVACGLWPLAWLVLIPGLMPVFGLAPWSGWLIVEEWDLLVLAAAAGGYARWAWSAPRRAKLNKVPPPGTTALIVGLLVVLLAASQLSALLRGVADAGGWSFDWYQGYREPLNALRQSKGLFAALLMLGLWRHAVRLGSQGPQGSQGSQQAVRHLRWGLCLSLLSISLAALWERLVYTGLTNFSTDYRTTALFWEMHVGGAALDGWLALTAAFTVREFMHTPSRWLWLAGGATLVLASYASLTTFSRGVYLAVPLGVAVALVLQARQWPAQDTAPRGRTGLELFTAALLLVSFSAAAALMFGASGYRGLLALTAACILALSVPNPLRQAAPAAVLVGVVCGAALCLVGWAATRFVDKGAYLFFAMTSGLCAAALLAWTRRPQGRLRLMGPVVLVAGFVATTAGMSLVALHWGGEEALARTWILPVGLLAIAAAAWFSPVPLWPSRARWQGSLMLLLLLSAAVVGTLKGGAYMTGRFTTSSSDLQGRFEHWAQGLGLLDGWDQRLLGKGAGRYVDNLALTADANNRPGDYRLQAEDGNTHLALVAGTHAMGWGEVLRMSQRVPAPVPGPIDIRVMARTDKASQLHFEICVKHLLYDAGCQVKQVWVPATGAPWRPYHLRLDAAPQPGGAWYAPHFVTFSVAAATAGGSIHIDQLSVKASDGEELLVNGNFSDGLARWFFTSDRHHMPWHIKNMLMHVLFEQGLVGLALHAALYSVVLLRLSVGPARRHALAPGLVGGLLALLVVGLFDSLLDVPRLAFLSYFLLMVGAWLRAPDTSKNPAHAG